MQAAAGRIWHYAGESGVARSAAARAALGLTRQGAGNFVQYRGATDGAAYITGLLALCWKLSGVLLTTFQPNSVSNGVRAGKLPRPVALTGHTGQGTGECVAENLRRRRSLRAF